MDIKTFYKLYRKKPTADKVDLLIDSLYYMSNNRLKAHETHLLHGNNDNARYYESEESHMRERARLMRELIRQDLTELSCPT